MLILFIVVCTVLCIWLGHRLCVWKEYAIAMEEHYYEAADQISTLSKEKYDAVQNLENVQRFLASMASRPIYANLNTEQIEMLSKMILAGTGKREYLN